VDWTTPQPQLGLAAAVASAIGSVASTFTGGWGSQTTTRLLGSAGMLGMRTQYKLPVLLFSWGVGGVLGISYKVTLEEVSITYERFNSAGIPIFATASLTMKEYSEPLPYTNPSSGGLPGRTRYVVTAGENVVRIANQAYGTPTAWRAVAEANDLDDPLRVRPGTVLYLPGPGELSEGRHT
jgi:nucleoid-associated protein YgaU